MRYICCLAAALCGGLITADARAQSAPASASIEFETDHRERGLSWSDGKAAFGLEASLPVTYDLALDLDAVTLRDSARHGGADVGLTIAPRYTLRTGGWDVSAGVRGNVFIGRSGTSYVELTGDVARTLGPAQLVVGAAFISTRSSPRACRERRSPSTAASATPAAHHAMTLAWRACVRAETTSTITWVPSIPPPTSLQACAIRALPSAPTRSIACLPGQIATRAPGSWPTCASPPDAKALLHRLKKGFLFRAGGDGRVALRWRRGRRAGYPPAGWPWQRSPLRPHHRASPSAP